MSCKPSLCLALGVMMLSLPLLAGCGDTSTTSPPANPSAAPGGTAPGGPADATPEPKKAT